MKLHAIGALLAAVLCLDACSGVIEAGGTPAPGLRAPTARLQLTVTIPHPSAVSTKSVVVAAGTSVLGVFDTTGQSNGCSTINGATVCSYFLIVPLAHLVLHITGFDQTGGAGRRICSGDVVVGAIPKNPATIHVVLGGVVNGVSIDVPGAGPAGTAESVPVVVMAKDADGNVIIGPERYSTPITVADDDKSGATALSLNNAAPTSVVHVASSSDSVKLIYNGGDVTTATIDANAGAPSVSSDAAFSPVPAIVGTYPMPSSDATPTQPGVLAKGKDGNIWMSFFGGRSNGFAKMTPGGVFTVFARNTPSTTGEVVYTMVTAAPGSSGAVWFTANTSRGAVAGNISPNGAVVEYPFPVQTCGNAANFGEDGMVSDGATGYWIALGCFSSTQLAHVTAQGVFTLSQQFPKFFVNAMVLGLDGKLYLAGQDNDNNKAMVAQLSVSGSHIIGAETLDTDAITWAWGAIAQTPDGELWLPYSDTHRNASIGHVRMATPFSNSPVALFPQRSNLASTIVPLPDNSVWVTYDYPVEAEHIAEGSDANTILPLQTLPFSSLSQDSLVVGGAVGADKDVYFATQVDPHAGTIVKVAY